MNEIVHKFLLAGYIFMPELHLKEPGFTYILVIHSINTKKKLKSLCRQETQFLFTEISLI